MDPLNNTFTLDSTIINMTCNPNSTLNTTNNTIDCETKIGLNSTTMSCFHRVIIYPWFILSLLVIVVNVAVLILIKAQKRKLLKCPSNIILTSLAVNDLFNGFFNMVVVCMRIYETNNTNCMVISSKFLTFFYYMDKVLLLNSIFHLVLLATERMISFCSPLKHRIITTSSRTLISVFIVWILSGILAPVEHFYDNTYPTKALIFGILLLCPTAIIVVQYLIMLGIIFRYMASRHEIANQLIVNRQKPCLIYFLMFVSFLALALPMVALVIYDSLFGDDSFMGNYYQVLEALVLVRVLPSLLNPFIYVFTKEDFRKEIKRYTKRYRGRGTDMTTLIRKPTTNITTTTSDTGGRLGLSRLISNDRTRKSI
ncbi:adrenocorticotropic hormone receptor-like [Clytia hemisphaerica]|uniref:adrenocorticotropic hormone receptor-like n=1 Tax=Clytia hemisphaerica TaxID=252671 RepID=UPI0034D39208